MKPRPRGTRQHLTTIAGSIILLAASCTATLPCPTASAQPAPASAPQTLEQLLSYADAHAPAVQTRRARVGRAEAARVEASFTLPANPQVSLGLGGRHAGSSAGLEIEAGVQQQLEIAGEPALRRAAADASRQELEAEVNEVRWALHVEVHRLFVDLLLAAERRAQAERFVTFSEGLKDVAQRQVDAGESSPLTLLVADADLAQTREVVIEAAQIEAGLKARLAAVIGWPDSALPPLTGTLPPRGHAPALPQLLELMAEHHPSLHARALAAEARRADLALERREAWPEPTLGLSYARESSPSPGSGPPSDIWMLSVSVPVPLWRQNQGGQARAAAEVEIAEQERAATARWLQGELTQAAIALNAAADRVDLYATGVVPQLQEHLDRLKRAYELGEVDIHQVSQTRQRLLEVTRKHLDAQVNYYETAAALEGLIGAELWTLIEENP